MSVKLTYSIANIGPYNFWAIPKCGNTTIKYLLLKKYQPESVRRLDGDANAWVHSESIINFITPDEANSNQCTNFTIVRDPIDRFKSLYSDFRLTRKNAILEIRDMDVDQLISYINDAEDESLLDIHLRSQSYFLQKFNGHIFNLNQLDLDNKLNQSKGSISLTIEQQKRIITMWGSDLTLLDSCSNIHTLIDYIS